MENDWSRSAGTRMSERKKLAWEKKEFKLLSLDGGGIRGLFTAELLKLWEKRIDEPIGNYFDYITGTSTGGIIALGLGKGLKAAEIAELYYHGGQTIFGASRDWRKRIKHMFGRKHDERGLEETLERVFGETKLVGSKRMLAIPAVEGEYGEAMVYKTPHHPDFKKDWKEEMRVVGRITSAAPTYFTAVNKDGYILLDGGLGANNPVLVGIIDILSCFEIDRRQLKVLSIGCQTEKLRVDQPLVYGGLARWAIKAAALMMQIQSHHSQGQAGLLLGRDNLTRVDPSKENKRISMDDWVTARKILPDMAKRAAEEEWEVVEKKFLGETRKPYVIQVPEAEQAAKGERE